MPPRVLVYWLAALLGLVPARVALGEATLDDEAAEELLWEALAADASAARSVAVEAPSPGIAGGGGLLDMALILDVAAAWFSDEEPLQTGAHDPSRTGFNLQQLEWALEANVDPFFRFHANLVFSQFGVEIEEAYARTLALRGGLQVRAGQFLTRFGRLNETHPHAWHFLDQPLVLGKFFGGENSRGLGVELSWLVPLPWYVEAIASATDAAGGCCARSFFGNDDLGVRGVEDLLATLALKQFFPMGHDLSLLLGASGQFGPNASGLGNRTMILGGDMYLRYRPTRSALRQSLSWQTEVLWRSRQVPYDVLQDLGLYSQLVWQWSPRWETGLRYELVTGIDQDPLDPTWTGSRARYSWQATHYPSHFSRLRLQASADMPTWRDQPIYALMLGLEVLVGAHGAHAF